MGHPTEPQSGAKLIPGSVTLVIDEAGQRLDCLLLSLKPAWPGFLS
jgi:predicted oxidoreductase